MTVEFARNRIVKIRSDYSKHDLNNMLGFKNKDDKESANNFVSWTDMR